MKKQIRRFFCVFFLFTSLNGMAQKQAEIIGKIVDTEGVEAPGATVVVQGTNIGTVADYDGKYKITVPDDQKSVLVFSFIGMKPKEMRVNGQKIINVVLEQNAVMLDEVVSVGYGTVKRRDLTGSVSSVKAEAINAVPVTSVAQALAGKIAGVSVTQAEGSPDANISIRVRGGLSITQDNEPLYIIDGFPSEQGLSGLDPSDIASIDVLKDASATAIYGARGGNGVILITTKEGFEGKAVISYDMYFGVKKLTNKMQLLTTEDFVRLEYERSMLGGATEKTNFVNMYGDGYDASLENPLDANMYNAFATIHDTYGNRPGIDWQGLIFDDASPTSQNHKISISGGNKTTKYTASYSYNNDEGIMPSSGLIRNNIRLRMDQQLSDKIRFTANVSHINEKTSGMGSLSESSYFSRMQHIIQYRPIISKFGDDQDLVNYQNDPIRDDESGNQMQNPIVSIENEYQSKLNKMSIFNGELLYNISKKLSYRGSVGYRDRSYTQDLFYQSGSRQAINSGAPYGQRNIQDYTTINYNNVLTYKTKLKAHAFDFMLGQENYILNYSRLQVKSTNFPDDNFGLNDMSLGETPEKPVTDAYGERTISFFGRMNYNYNQRYLATFTMRADGSSKFGINNKWGYFPSASFAWRASEENFIKELNAFSNLKLRLSYGSAGNNRIGTFRSLSRMSSSWQPFENSTTVSYFSSQLPNPDLKWETNVSANLGLDMGFFDQKLQIVVDMYNNQTQNLLLESKVPLLSGYASTIKNVGKTQNRGLEVTINTMNINTKDFRWETSFNFSTNKNKVLQLTAADYFTTRSGWASASEFNDDDYRIEIGEPLGNMYGYKLIGLYSVDDFDYDPVAKKYTVKEGVAYDPDNYPKPGYSKFENFVASDTIINANDKQVIGNATPDFIGGIVNSFTYKNFDFSFALNFSIGGDVYNANKMYFTKTSNRYRNSLAITSERFTYIDPETGANVYNDPERLAAINVNSTTASVDGTAVMRFHSGYIEDGSYLRLNNFTFGYTLPKDVLKKLRLSTMRFYTSGYNLLTLTKYSGFDPEVNTKPNGGLTPGIDWGAYPRSLSFVVGVNMSF
jgi:TonB-dependent starch-binding outer membrane protein SusC